MTEAVGNIVEKWEMTYQSLEHLIDDTRPHAESDREKPAPTDDKVNFIPELCNTLYITLHYLQKMILSEEEEIARALKNLNRCLSFDGLKPPAGSTLSGDAKESECSPNLLPFHFNQ